MVATAFSNNKYVSRGRKKLASRNIYLEGLVALYERIAKSSANEIVHKIAARLKMSRNNRPPMKVSRLANICEKYPGKVYAVVAKILDDNCFLEVPKMQIVALQFSKSAKEKIEKAGGSAHTLDQLFEVAPGLENVALFRGKFTARKAYKYFGAPGDRHSRTYPKTTSKGKNREKRLLK